MQTKKYIITGLLGLAVVGIGAVFLMRGGNISGVSEIARDGSLYSYVPGYADQLIYIHVDEDLLDILVKMDPSQYSDTTFQQLVKRVDTALITQYATGELVHNLLFLEGEEIDISELQALGLLADAENNKAKKLNDTLWLYGPAHSLDRQESTSYTLSDNIILYEYIQQIHAGDYNIGFLANPLAGQQLPFMEQFAGKLLYTALMTRLDPEGIAGTLQLQFAEGIVSERGSSFTPAFAEWVGEDTLVYAEMYDLRGLFGIDEQQFMSLAPILLGQYGQAYGALLSSDDYDTFYNALHGHVGIFLNASSQSIFGVGASLVFDTPELFDILTMMNPVWVGLFEGMVGSGAIQIENTPTGIAYTATSSLLGGEAGLTLATIEKGTSTTTLSLLGGTATAGDRDIYDPVYTDETSLVFRIDSDGLETLGGVQPLVGEIALPNGTQNLSKGIFQGNLQTQADTSRIILNFTVIPSNS